MFKLIYSFFLYGSLARNTPLQAGNIGSALLNAKSPKGRAEALGVAPLPSYD